jgi:hypothetical protein
MIATPLLESARGARERRTVSIHQAKLRKARIARGEHHRARPYNRAFLNRNAFPITVTELNVIAALAIIGLNSNPKKG